MMVPSGYTQLSYIEGTGEQYVNTRFNATSTTEARVVASINAISAGQTAILFGVTRTDDVTDGGFLMGKSAYGDTS